MRPLSISLVGLCVASFGCANIVCPDGRVTYDQQSCVCEEGKVESRGDDDLCVPGGSQPVSIDAGGMDASVRVAAALPCPGDAGCPAADRARDASVPDASAPDASAPDASR